MVSESMTYNLAYVVINEHTFHNSGMLLHVYPVCVCVCDTVCFFDVHVCVYVSVYMALCVYMCAYVYVCVCVCVYIWHCVCVCVYIWHCVCVCVFVCM